MSSNLKHPAWRPNTIATRSVSDLDYALRKFLPRLPPNIGMVVGVPRSGMLPASLLSTYLNLPLNDVEGVLLGKNGSSGHRPIELQNPLRDALLVVDDSIASGTSNAEVREKLKVANIGRPIYFLAVYGTEEKQHLCDFVCEIVPQPRIFSWNAVNSWVVSSACVDIDGLLCPDPSPEENDDDAKYKIFLESAPTLYSCRTRIRHLVTSRLEKYRDLTENWLNRNGILFDNLHMADLSSALERARKGPKFHAQHKSRIYRNLADTTLFLESAKWQAELIAEMAGKPVFCCENGAFISPSFGSIRREQARYYWRYPRALAGLLKRRYFN